MSIIVIREVNASPIEDKILKTYLAASESWGISWFVDGRAWFVRSPDEAAFLKDLRQKEKQNNKFVLHFNSYVTGDVIHANEQPIPVSDVGILSIDGFICRYPNDIDKRFAFTGKAKSDEFIIAEVFKKFCLEHADLSPIGKWKKFLNDYNKFLRNATLVLMLYEDGTILNNKPEYGVYKNGSKLWYSDYFLIEQDADREFENEDWTDEVGLIEKRLARWTLTNKRELIFLTEAELTYLCEEYPHQMSEIIKFNEMGFDKIDDDEEDLNLPSSHKQCYDCKEPFDTNLLISHSLHGVLIYLCSECVFENGIPSQ